MNKSTIVIIGVIILIGFSLLVAANLILYKTWGGNEWEYVPMYDGVEMECDFNFLQKPTNCRPIFPDNGFPNGEKESLTFEKSILVTDKDATYEIPYSMDNGTITNAVLNCKEGSLFLLVNSDDDGILKLDIPNNLFSSVFMVIIDGKETVDGVSIIDDIITINYSENTKNIEIMAVFTLTPYKYDGVCDVISENKPELSPESGWTNKDGGYEDPFSGSIEIGEYSNFNYQITSGLVDSMDYNVDSNSLIIEIIPIKDGEFNLTIPTGKDDLFKDGICEKNGQIPDSEDIMVLIDGEEVESDMSEINNDLINVKIQFGVNAKIIEVIQTCLV